MSSEFTRNRPNRPFFKWADRSYLQLELRVAALTALNLAAVITLRGVVDEVSITLDGRLRQCKNPNRCMFTEFDRHESSRDNDLVFESFIQCGARDVPLP